MSKKIAVDFTVVGHQPEVIEFLRLCRFITTFGFHGTNRSIKVNVDGDGSGHLQFVGKKESGSPFLFEPFELEDIGDVKEFQVDIGE